MVPSIKRKKEKFARSRFREEEAGNFFRKTSSGLSSAFSLIIALFFTPALIASSIFSKEILLPFANIFLCLGYLTNFSYRIYKKEVGKAELIVTALTLAAFLAVGFFFFPPVAAVSLLSVIQLVNQAAVIINMFFLIKHVIVPPVKQLVEKMAHRLGFDISRPYFSKPPLTPEADVYIIDRLLKKNYGHDSHSKEYDPNELVNLNKLLKKLTLYINKYAEVLLGYIRNKDKIDALKRTIEQLERGDPNDSYAFIKSKISFKETKIELLQEARDKVQLALSNPSIQIYEKEALAFFHKTVFRKHDRTQLLTNGLDNLNQEIKRQEAKLASLTECLPLSPAAGN